MIAESSTPLDLQAIAAEFLAAGCVLIPAVLSGEQVAALRGKTDQYASAIGDDRHVSFVGETMVLRHCHELDPLFREMITLPPILKIAETILGPGAEFNAMNVIRNNLGEAISRWHVDDVLEFPLPAEIPRFDARIRMPVFWMTIQVALTDIDSTEDGPTQFVPGSHYSGRHPNSQETPEFEGKGPENVLCRAGDAYLTNHQCWHRGAPNLSGRTRYVMQLQYAQRWASARFKGAA